MYFIVRSIVWASELLSPALRDLLPSEVIVARSASEFVEAKRDAKTVSFIDQVMLEDLDRAALESGVRIDRIGPVVAIFDEPLQNTIGWVAAHPWLSHVVSASMLRHPIAAEHLGNVIATLTSNRPPRLLDWLGPTVTGRRVRLARASKRAERLERLSAFLESRGVGARTIEQLRDAAEELLTNAFYDAPAAAGVTQPISRTRDVRLPEDSACDMVYGCRDDLAVVRVRDPFGSLSRARLVEVLTRCARTDMQVEVDETMGGAGLGLWRIFSAASFVAISVVRNRRTEVLVGIGKRVSSARRPFAFHLFFQEDTDAAPGRRLVDADSGKPQVNQSVTIVTK
jgi:hypothetical protein